MKPLLILLLSVALSLMSACGGTTDEEDAQAAHDKQAPQPPDCIAHPEACK